MGGPINLALQSLDLKNMWVSNANCGTANWSCKVWPLSPEHFQTWHSRGMLLGEVILPCSNSLTDHSHLTLVPRNLGDALGTQGRGDAVACGHAC